MNEANNVSKSEQASEQPLDMKVNEVNNEFVQPDFYCSATNYLPHAIRYRLLDRETVKEIYNYGGLLRELPDQSPPRK